MINLGDPLDRLRAANPVLLTDASLPPADPLLSRRITSGDARRTVGPEVRRRRQRRLVPVLVVASLVGVAAGWGLLRGDVTKPGKVACYERADLESATEVAGVDERGTVEACAELWRRGVLGEGGVAPALAECVLESGVVGVFPTTPGTDVCVGLDLPPVPTSAPTSPAPPGPIGGYLAFRDAVTAAFLDSPCVDPEAGSAIVRRELDRAGLTGWTVRAGGGLAGDGFSAQRPCATLALQPENTEVILVPSPPR